MTVSKSTHVSISNSLSFLLMIVVAKLCLTLCDPMNCSMPGFPVLHYLPEFAQTHVCWLGDAIQPSHPLSPSSPPASNLSQHQGLFQWVSSSHQVAKVLEIRHQSFQGIVRVGLLQDWLSHVYRVFFTRFSVGHLGCFHVLAEEIYFEQKIFLGWWGKIPD